MNISVDLQTCETYLIQSFNTLQPAPTECMKLIPQTQYDEVKSICEGPIKAPFTSLSSSHTEYSAKLIDLLMVPQNFTTFMMTVMLLRECVKSDIFYHSVAVALTNMTDTPEKLRIPHPFHVMPSRFFPGFTLSNNISSGKLIYDNNMTYLGGVVVSEEFNGINESHPEQVLAYFREDIGANSFHWHWHTLHPVEAFLRPKIHSADRRGEDFFFAHRQILRRYDAERFAFGLKKVENVKSWTDPIDFGYFSQLFSHGFNVPYPPRLAKMKLHDIIVPERLTVEYFLLIIDRIWQAIRDGYVVKPDGSKLELSLENGTDILGSIIQSNPFSPNLDYYGSLHHVGHILLSQVIERVNNPWELSMMGVLGYSETSMRDPFFYMWHRFLDSFFVLHKSGLPAYTEEELNWNDISIRFVDILNSESEVVNKLNTYFEERILMVSNDVDFMFPNATVPVKTTYLQHDQFEYVIRVKNPTQRILQSVVRIFLAPKHNENGKEASDEELHDMFFEMDKFTATIPPGLHLIVKSSINSSITLSPSGTWHNLQQDPFKYQSVSDYDVACECGWPHNLLVPHGKSEGMYFKLLVMMTDWEKDKVENSTGSLYPKCNFGISMCGVIQGKFPDKRPMGFPFDRPPKFKASERYFKRSNMFMTDIIIYHRNETRPAKIIKEDPVIVDSIL